jgi:hypothetical protein
LDRRIHGHHRRRLGIPIVARLSDRKLEMRDQDRLSIAKMFARSSLIAAIVCLLFGTLAGRAFPADPLAALQAGVPDSPADLSASQTENLKAAA